MKYILAGLAALTTAFASGLELSPGEAAIPQAQGSDTTPDGRQIAVTTKCLRIDGDPAVPVMGEMHYARVPESEWRDYIRKMKAGGLDIIATYCFWIHHEENEGVFDFSGRRNLGEFLRICEEEGMMVVLRLGPWCHGEVRNGGFPDWLVERLGAKSKRLRSTDPEYMALVEKYWRKLFEQVDGHLWKQGGCVTGCQIENECRGPWPYMQALKDLLRKIGFDTPFYTRTGWPAMKGRIKYGELLPLYGDYVDGHWGRGNEVSPGPFRKIWRFTAQRSSENIATEMISSDLLGKDEFAVAQYPFLTCELGGGMSYAYHRRVRVDACDTYSIALLKLGSGSNMLGYYMYASGTNPARGNTWYNESQTSPYTNHNDLPPLSYDYQSPIGEFGELNEVYFKLQPLHKFCKSFAKDFALEEPEFFNEHHTRRGPFHFYCDYNRVTNRTGRAYILPENWKTRLGTIKSATAQPVEWQGDTLVMMKVAGLEPHVEFEGAPFAVKFIDPPEAPAVRELQAIALDAFKPVREAGKAREVKLGAHGVAMQPDESDWDSAAEWKLEADLSQNRDAILEIEYLGDVARLYVDGIPVSDNFYSGRAFRTALWRIPDGEITIKVLPWSDSELIYIESPNRPKTCGAAIESARLIKR